MNRTFITHAAFSLILLIGGFLQMDLRSQGLDPRTSGSTYVVAYPDTVSNWYDSRFPKKLNDTVALIIYSSVDNVVFITSPSGYVRNVSMKGGKFDVIYLTAYEKPAKNPIATQIGVAAWNTFRVETKRPILLYCYITTNFGTEAFTPLPVESWGREYFAASHPGEVAANQFPGGETTYGAKNIMAPSEMVITAAFDSTIVRIYPSSRTEFIGKPPLVITLKANQCYLLETFVDTASKNQGVVQSEIAGTRIVSSRPISVISGNTRAQLNSNEQGGLARNSFKNLCIEALAPVEQHGHEFVFLPTWDARRITGASNENIKVKRASEFVRIYGEDSTTTTVTHDSGVGTVEMAGVYQDRIWKPQARAYHTSNPSQAFMTSTATVIFNGNIGSIGFLGASYDAYAPYMVELVAREQWTTFAPFYAPTSPPGMEHFVNIVADTASAQRIFDERGAQVEFNNGAVPGTDLVWGSMAVAPGLTHYFVGRDGARFYAFAYGLWKGFELYRPGSTKEKDGPPGLAGGGRETRDHLLHPSEYVEENAQSYGYPLAPARISLAEHDSLVIETIIECASLHCRVRSANANPLGLRTIYLDSLSTRSDIVAKSATWKTDVIGASETEFDVVLHSGASGDSGGIIIQDRSGKVYRVPFKFTSDHIDFKAGKSLRLAQTRYPNARDTVVLITNLTPNPLVVRSVALSGRQSGFTITGTSPTLPTTLQPQATIEVGVRFVPPAANTTVRDTITATSDKCDIHLALQAESLLPGSAPTPPCQGSIVGETRSSQSRGEIDVHYRLECPSNVKIQMYNQLGRLVREDYREGLDAGEGSIALDATGLPQGTYWLRLSTNNWSATTAIIFLR